MTKLTTLLIDDDKNFCQTFQSLSEDSFDLTIAHSGKYGLRELNKTTPQVVLLDFKLGRGMNGLEVLKRIKKSHPDLPVIMITDFANIETAVEAMKIGAFHYTSKSPNINALKLIIERQLEQINWKLLLQENAKNQYVKFVSQSQVMQEILQKIKTVAKIDSTVLIEGESGTGKEVCAREIHWMSTRKDKPFVAINCSTLAPQLFESEFFGHEKGAFTGAESQKKGKLELANSGTIFLDEIGDLPLESQAKILRAIEEKNFTRLGGTETISVDVRIIAASNKNLQQMVADRQFREDLYYRLSVITIFLPRLRERAEDIPDLVKLFLQRFSREMNKPILNMSPEAIKKLVSHNWPGNIRELKNYIERAVAFHNIDQSISADEILLKQDSANISYPAKLLDMPYEQAKNNLLHDFKQVYFKRALDLNNGNISATAKKLQINRSALHKMLKELEENN